MLIATEAQPELHECPKCGKRALVARGDRFHCLWCNFTRDVSEPEPETNLLGIVLAVLVLIALVLSIPQKPTCVNGRCPAEVTHPQQSSPF